mmetsp:Transcript_31297/g.79827  ORF Transcript_31297/g.79827 Transcript_31297/m.79827 type:complete len:109 (-) Transcript_31297:721-1047(-)
MWTFWWETAGFGRCWCACCIGWDSAAGPLLLGASHVHPPLWGGQLAGPWACDAVVAPSSGLTRVLLASSRAAHEGVAIQYVDHHCERCERHGTWGFQPFRLSVRAFGS